MKRLFKIAKILKFSQDFISKWSSFLEESNDNLPYANRFLPIGMDEFGDDYPNFVKENEASLREIESLGGGSLPVFLAHGTRGSAFTLGSDKILKFMQDPYEFKSYQVMQARHHQGGALGAEAPQIYTLGALTWKGQPCSYWVVMERLHVDESLLELEKSMLLDMLSTTLATLWFQPDSKTIFGSQTPEKGSSLQLKDLESNWNSFKTKAIRSLSAYGFSSEPFSIQKFDKFFQISPESLADFEASGGNREDLTELAIWLLESDLVQDLLRPYLTQIMLNVAHGYLDFQSQNLGWRREGESYRPIFFDPGYDFETITKELQGENLE